MNHSQHRLSPPGPPLEYVLAVTARAWRLTGPTTLRRLRAKRGAAAQAPQQSRSGDAKPQENSIGHP